MSKTGSIARNFHEGSRSEYLGQYVFSAFGSAIPVPHQEDSGIDLHCTLGDPKGHLMFVKNYFTVQIKSNSNNIIFDGHDSVAWLLSHNYPLLVCVIIKKTNNIKIYSTNKIYGLPGPIDFSYLELELGTDVSIEKAGCRILGIGRPILEFDLSQISESEHIRKCKAIIREWVRVDQENINFRNRHQGVRVGYQDYETNIIPIQKVFAGHYWSTSSNAERQMQINNILIDLSAQLITCFDVFDKDVYGKVIDIAKTILMKNESRNTAEIYLFQQVANTIATKHELDERFEFDVELDST